MDGRWDCVCGADALAGAFCPFCGRRSPSGHLPPLPAAADAWLPPVPPRRVGLTPATGTLTAVIAAILLVAGSVVALRSPSPVTSTSRTLDEAVRRGMRFVADFRGKPFLADVDVTLLGDEAFRRELVGEEDDDPGEDEADFEATLYGLQLAEPGEDVDAEEEALLSDTVVGFYDDETERLVVRGGALTPYAELTLVHELTHAWQDQHFDLGALWEETDTDDEALALRALVEGDALRVESAWLEDQPEDVREAIEEVEEGFEEGDVEDLPKAAVTLNLLYGFPYEVGTAFVESLGDNERVDAAFAKPPTTTAQVFEPEKYLAGDEPGNPPDPRAEGTVVDRGTLGQVGLALYLAAGGAGERTIEAAYGWDGDEYVTWRVGGRLCTTVSIEMDDEDEREELLEELERRRLPRVTRQSDDGLSFVSCQD